MGHKTRKNKVPNKNALLNGSMKCYQKAEWGTFLRGLNWRLLLIMDGQCWDFLVKTGSKSVFAQMKITANQRASSDTVWPMRGPADLIWSHKTLFVEMIMTDEDCITPYVRWSAANQAQIHCTWSLPYLASYIPAGWVISEKMANGLRRAKYK